MPEETVEDFSPQQRRGMFIFMRQIVACVFLAALLQSYAKPDTYFFYLGGTLLITGTVMSAYTAYWWYRYAPPSLMLFGSCTICCAILACYSF